MNLFNPNIATCFSISDIVNQNKFVMKLHDGFRFLCLILLLQIASCVGEDELIAEARSGDAGPSIVDEVEPQQGEELQQSEKGQKPDELSQQQDVRSEQQEAQSQQKDVNSQQQEVGAQQQEDIASLVQEQQIQQEDAAGEEASGSSQSEGEPSEAVDYSG